MIARLRERIRGWLGVTQDIAKIEEQIRTLEKRQKNLEVAIAEYEAPKQEPLPALKPAPYMSITQRRAMLEKKDAELAARLRG